mgnify:CR=1 FL=1
MGQAIMTAGKRTKNGIVWVGLQTTDADGNEDYQIAVVDTYIELLKRKKSIGKGDESNG